MRYDVATAISQGQRDYQEDAVIADFSLGNDFGFAVLADGMGGHAAGDVASKVVVTEVFSELKLQVGDILALEEEIVDVLRGVAEAANACIDSLVNENTSLRGMGATLIAPVFFAERMYWISIGDSPLYLFRSGSLRQLNEDHSLAPQIDVMVKTGQIDEETARNHPDRNSLTSVVMGRKIPQMDCPVEAFELQSDDIVIAASDGLQYLENAEIEALLKKTQKKRSEEVAESLLKAIDENGHPDQDNVSMVVVKMK